MPIGFTGTDHWLQIFDKIKEETMAFQNASVGNGVSFKVILNKNKKYIRSKTHSSYKKEKRWNNFSLEIVMPFWLIGNEQNEL